MTASDDVSPGHFLDHVPGFQKTAALRAAIALDLFSAIANGDDMAASLARRVGAAERGVRIVCDFLIVNGHLEKARERYRLTPSSAVFLDRASPACMASVVDAYTLRELDAMARAAGFTGVSSQPLPPSPQTMIVLS